MKKILKWTGIILLVLFLILFSIPFLFKGKIVAMVKQSANDNLTAKVDFGDFDLSLIRSFPTLSLRISNLSIIGTDDFAGDTLVYAKTTSLTVDIMSVISGDQIKIKSVGLDSPVMNFLVHKDGKNNWSITKPAAPGAPASETKFKASLQKYTVDHGRVVYDDRTMPFHLQLDDFSHTGKGDFTQDLFVLSTHTDINELTINYGGVNYVTRAKTVADADIDMDIKNFKFTFKDNHITLSELPLTFSGWLAMPGKDIDMDLKFGAVKSDFKNFISLIPAVYSSSFKDLKSSGKMGFEGYAKGKYNDKSLPGFGITLMVENGMFKYPSLPAAVEDVQVNLKITNPDGVTDHTSIDLSKMHVVMAGAPFDARLKLSTPISDLNVDAFVKGKVDLTNMQKIVPLEKGTSLSGVITADLSAKGRYSSIKQQRYQDFNASGQLGVTGLNYSSAAMAHPMLIRNLQMTFNPKQVALTAFDAQAGKSDFKASGSLENFIPYALKGETLKGILSLNSSVIDLNEWMSPAATPAKKDTVALTVLDVPANIDFAMNASIGLLKYEDINMKNVKGQILIKNKEVNMTQLGMQLLDGSMVMNGKYSSADIKKPSFDFGLGITDFDVQKTGAAFPTVQKMAPIVKSASGKYSCKMTVKGLLDQKMQPVMNTLSGGGNLITSAIIVQDFPPTQKIADALKIESLKKITVPKTNLSFHFIDGRVTVDPFDADLNGIKAKIAGSNGFDQTIDYKINAEIKRSSLGGAANSAINGIVAQANSKGANFSAGDVIPVSLGIGGTVTNPKVTTDLNKAGAKAMDDLKAAAAAEFEKKKKEAEDKLRAEADARIQAEKDKLKKEADAKAKAAADEAKNQLQKQAGDKLKDLFKKPK